MAGKRGPQSFQGFPSVSPSFKEMPVVVLVVFPVIETHRLQQK